MKSIAYRFIGLASFKGFTLDRSRDFVKEALEEIEACCGIEFYEGYGTPDNCIKFQWIPFSPGREFEVKDEYVYLSRTGELKKQWIRNPHLIKGMIQMAVLQQLGLNAVGVKDHLNTHRVHWLQSQYGKPEASFWPTELSSIGHRVQVLQVLRENYATYRDLCVSMDKRAETHAEVLRTKAKIAELTDHYDQTRDKWLEAELIHLSDA